MKVSTSCCEFWRIYGTVLFSKTIMLTVCVWPLSSVNVSPWYVWTYLSMHLFETAVLLCFALPLIDLSEPELNRFGWVGWIQFKWSVVLFRTIFGNCSILGWHVNAQPIPRLGYIWTCEFIFLKWESINLFLWIVKNIRVFVVFKHCSKNHPRRPTRR